MKAFYDKKPLILENVGNGSFLYRWGIKEEVLDGRLQWECNEVTVWMPLSDNKITEAVIAELWSVDYEQKLLNEYNAALLGLYDNDEAIAKIESYKTFLAERKAIKARIDADWKTINGK